MTGPLSDCFHGSFASAGHNKMKIKMAIFAAASILVTASPAWATAVSSGWLINGGLGTNWSSDLGVDFSQQVHHDANEPSFTNSGTTTPLTPYGHEFSNQGVLVSLDVNKRGLGVLGGTVSAFSPAAGEIEGKVFHTRMDLHTPPIDQYGMFTSAFIGGPIYFGGIPPGFPTIVYWGFQWKIDVTRGDPSQSLAADLRPPGIGAINISGMHNDSGLIFGSVCLNRGDGGCSGTGSGSVNPEFSFELGNGASSSSRGAAATLDTWLTFSSAPITRMPLLSPVPDPETYAMLIAGLGLVAGFVGRRRKPAKLA